MLDLARLDRLAVDWLQFHGIITDKAQLSPTTVDGLFVEIQGKVQDLQSLRKLFKQGKIDDATELITSRYPQFLQEDQEINFKLHRQRFVEHLRGCTDPQQALNYLRTEIPADLVKTHDSELKQLSLMLLYREGTRDSPVAEEWQFSRRTELAQMVLKRLEQFLAISEPSLSLSIRYMYLIHNMFYALRAGSSPIQSEMDLLVIPADAQGQLRQFASLESEFNSQSEPSSRIDEGDVFTLAQLMGLVPDAARIEIQEAGGSVSNALISCLTRMLTTDVERLVKLTLDYCEYRGLLCDNFREVKDSFITGQQRQNLERVTTICDYLSTISESVQETQFSDSPQLHTTFTMGGAVNEIMKLVPNFAEQNTELFFTLKRWQMVELIRRRDYKEALELAKRDLASLSLRHPELVNPFKEIALLLIYPPPGHANDNSDKLKTKAISEAWTRATPEALAAPVYVALTSALSIKEPKLVEILEYLLDIHSKWFKQQSSEDPFAEAVGITSLIREKFPSLAALATILSPNGSSTSSSLEYDSQFCDASELAAAKAEAAQSGIKNEDITALQEILACSQIEAIRLLQRHGGRLTDALAVIFGE